jgi:hypothetical protein
VPRRRLRRPASILLAVTLLPLLGPVVSAAHAEGRGAVHPCEAAMPVAPADATPGPASERPVPCGAALKLPCCNQVAALSSGGATVPPAPPSFPLPAPPDSPLAHATLERPWAHGGAPRAAPDLLASTVLRF